MAKKENNRYTYAMFIHILLLAHSFSSMHIKVAPNILREFRIQKKRGKISFSRITNYSNRSRHVWYNGMYLET